MALEMGQRIGELQCAHIEPGQAGGLHRSGLDPRKSSDGGLHLCMVFPKPGKKPLAPGLSVTIGGLGCGIGQGADAGHEAALGFPEAAPERG